MSRTLLAIDDDAVLLGLIGRFLKRKGWGYEKAMTGEEGLKKARESKPDVVLLDVELPDETGWNVCRSLKQDAALRSVPVVMISGKRIVGEDRAKGLEYGADDYLVKPFDLSVMLLKIEAILRVTERRAS